MERKISEVFIKGKKYYRARVNAKGAHSVRFITKKSRAELEDYLSVKNDFIKRDATGAIASNYSVEQLADIKRAMELLPTGFTLVDAVKRLTDYHSEHSVEDAVSTFLSVKSGKDIDCKYMADIETHLRRFSEDFKNFADATPENIIKWLLNLRGKNGELFSSKTRNHYKGALVQFFAFCLRRDFITKNPFDKISPDDLPSVVSAPPEILTVDQSYAFMQMLVEHFPQFVKFYAIALFAGVRVAEVERLTDENIDKANKRLYLPHHVQKTSRADVLEDIEPNFWKWIDFAGANPIIRPKDKEKLKFNKLLKFKLPHNFARHSFATYHYSLYLDKRRTCAITRHSEAMLLRHYLALRVDKKTARSFFNIAP